MLCYLLSISGYFAPLDRVCFSIIIVTILFVGCYLFQCCMPNSYGDIQSHFMIDWYPADFQCVIILDPQLLLLLHTTFVSVPIVKYLYEVCRIAIFLHVF